MGPGFLGFGVAAFEGFWIWALPCLSVAHNKPCRTRPQSVLQPPAPPPPPTRPRQTHSLPVSGSALFRLHVLYANLLDFRGGLDRPSEGSGLLLKSPPPLEGIFFRSFAVVPCFVICFFFFSFLFRYTKESSV